MTVNTNGNRFGPTINVNQERLDEVYTMIQETRDSQLRTEKMVADFMTAIQGNPMLRAMGAKFGV